MPELPEVETIRRGLQYHVAGATVASVRTSGARLRGPQHDLTGLQGHTLASFGRHGKFLLVGLGDGGTWVVHLGMTGKLLIHDEEPAPPHTHLELRLDDGRRLRYCDPRRFGMMALHTSDLHDDAPDGRRPLRSQQVPSPPGPRPWERIPELAHYGPDALDPDLEPAWFATVLGASGAPLKAFLLDQTKLAGVGNIYACEALWRAGASPRRRARNTRNPALLLESVRDVLEESITQGGTSFNDYVDAIGRPGRFLLDVAVFRREGAPCPRCRTAVRRIVQAGRSTFFCPRCQR